MFRRCSYDPLVGLEALPGEADTENRSHDRQGARPPLATWKSLLAEEDPRQLYHRLQDSDPLDLFPLCAHRLRERAFLVDSERIHRLTLARIVLCAKSAPPEPERDWLLEQIDHAIRIALQEDQQLDEAGHPCEEDSNYEFLVRAFAMEPTLACSAAVAFNALDEFPRRVFFALADGTPINTCIENGLGTTREEVGAAMRKALFAMKYLDDSVRFDNRGRDR